MELEVGCADVLICLLLFSSIYFPLATNQPKIRYNHQKRKCACKGKQVSLPG
jgi:hypothetical protein